MVDHAAAATTEFRVGRVLSRSFSTLFRNILPFGLLALVISSPTYVYVILAGPGSMAMTADPTLYWPTFGAQSLIIGIVGFLLSYLIMAALVYGTIQDLKHDPAGLGECFAKGLVLMFPVVGVAIVMLLLLIVVMLVTVIPGSLVIGLFGLAIESPVFELISIPLMFALFIPTVYVLIMLWATIPVAVIERRGLGSLVRSTVLTKGYRWRIFVLLVLLIVVGLAVGLPLGALGSVVTEIGMAEGGVAGSAYLTGLVAIDWVISAFISALSAVLAAVTYHDLRVAKEGADTDQIASVFD